MNLAATQTPPTQVLQVDVCGQRWELERHGDLESLWEALGQDAEACAGAFGEDERLPYWVELWPAGLLLARWLCRKGEAIAGRHCLDLGCGLGLATLVAAAQGAMVLGLDYEWPAVVYAARNARRNAGRLSRAPLLTQMDWRAPALRSGSVACIWGADVLYERRFAEPVLAMLRHALAPDGVAWIADPGRCTHDAFVTLARGEGWRCEKVMEETVAQISSAGPDVDAAIWELSRNP